MCQVLTESQLWCYSKTPPVFAVRSPPTPLTLGLPFSRCQPGTSKFLQLSHPDSLVSTPPAAQISWTCLHLPDTYQSALGTTGLQIKGRWKETIQNLPFAHCTTLPPHKHTHTHTCTHTHIHIYTAHKYTRACTHAHMCTRVRVPIDLRAHIRACIDTHTHTHAKSPEAGERVILSHHQPPHGSPCMLEFLQILSP